jgi:hypothetical protein
MALTRFGRAEKQDVGTVHPQLPAPVRRVLGHRRCEYPRAEAPIMRAYRLEQPPNPTGHHFGWSD